MQHPYALAEGAKYRPLRWNEPSGEHKEFPNSIDLFRFIAEHGWEFVTVIPRGKTGTYRQDSFKRSTDS
jgi:hypothetical protein